jgi:hypothetical protein
MTTKCGNKAAGTRCTDRIFRKHSLQLGHCKSLRHQSHALGCRHTASERSERATATQARVDSASSAMGKHWAPTIALVSVSFLWATYGPCVRLIFETPGANLADHKCPLT